jgi:hypothetical protein
VTSLRELEAFAKPLCHVPSGWSLTLLMNRISPALLQTAFFADHLTEP